jgi:hypothetical protein
MVTALIGAEKALGLAYMATPFEWLPVIVGSITVVSGVGLIWLCRQENKDIQISASADIQNTSIASTYIVSTSIVNNNVVDAIIVGTGMPSSNAASVNTVGYADALSGNIASTTHNGPSRHQLVSKTLVGILIIVAIAGIAWTGISLFYPYKISLISGSLDTGHHYETRFKSLRCSSLGGYALLLAAVVNLLTSIDLLRNRIDIKHALSLELFSAVLLMTTVLTGNTPMVTWFSDIPSDIQHGIGTPYASLTETMLTNIPWLVAIGFVCFYVVFLTICIAATYRLKISRGSS